MKHLILKSIRAMYRRWSVLGFVLVCKHELQELEANVDAMDAFTTPEKRLSNLQLQMLSIVDQAEANLWPACNDCRKAMTYQTPDEFAVRVWERSASNTRLMSNELAAAQNLTLAQKLDANIDIMLSAAGGIHFMRHTYEPAPAEEESQEAKNS